MSAALELLEEGGTDTPPPQVAEAAVDDLWESSVFECRASSFCCIT